MSKRLNKRQQRLEEELKQQEQLQEQTQTIVEPDADELDERESSPNQPSSAAPANVFAALNDGLDDAEDEVDESSEAEVDAPKKKSNKKKKKKKIKAGVPSDLVPSSGTPDEASSRTSTSTPAKQTPAGKKRAANKDTMGMDELDLALAELKEKYGDLDQPKASSSAAGPAESTTSSSYALRTLLAVDLKNLDADAELRKFFGAKVVGAAAASSSPHNSKRGTLLKTHLAKPKPNWPPPNSFLGLGMREMTDDEIRDKRARMGAKGLKNDGRTEKWWTFEHGGDFREAVRQFLGAVRSLDPNQIFALLQVYSYFTDGNLQMSEVYRQQSDLTQASEYIDRALFAFERAFAPGFSLTSGNVRLDFDRIENRGFYLALIRNLQFLGRRGCWLTAFTFAKLLLSMDPHTDPQGSLFWLDFLAVKSSSHNWLLSLLSTWDASLSDLGWKSSSSEGEKERISLAALPGMAWAKALATRAEEGKGKDVDRTKSDQALKEAILGFPWVLPLLADKVGFSLPSEARSHELLQLRLGYTPGSLTTLHLLSHIYVLRSSALWKDPSTLSWLKSRLPTILPTLLDPAAPSPPNRAHALEHFKNGTPESIVRHVMVAEDNSGLLGFLNEEQRERLGMAFDPVPPRRSVTQYDNDYFNGLSSSRRRNHNVRATGSDEEEADDVGFMQAIANSLMQMTGVGGEGAGEQGGVMAALAGRMQNLFGAGGGGGTEEERHEVMEQLMAMAQANRGAGHVPGGFPGGAGEAEEGDGFETVEE